MPSVWRLCARLTKLTKTDYQGGREYCGGSGNSNQQQQYWNPGESCVNAIFRNTDRKTLASWLIILIALCVRNLIKFHQNFKTKVTTAEVVVILITIINNFNSLHDNHRSLLLFTNNPYSLVQRGYILYWILLFLCQHIVFLRLSKRKKLGFRVCVCACVLVPNL